ncbi:hypothetical protein H0H81_011440 [Sphagnurus paluster]|uniref:Uncharacterized protein n=1 Tax=Sphagnurus paluster TaxID=117069 RepID=A0A9P7GSD5_9AGAR|nr:hypothetical protein H0H81_011440 [Sphagnurus paluster]
MGRIVASLLSTTTTIIMSVPCLTSNAQALPTSFTGTTLNRLLDILLPLLWLSIAPLIAATHLTSGHAILHYAYPHSPSWAAPLLSTAFVGAIGGTIVGMPLVPVVIYLLFIRAQQRLEQHNLANPEEARPLNSFRTCMERTGCAAIILAGVLGAGALGAICLGESGSERGGGVLSSGGAAAAGVVGSAAVWGCVFGFLALFFDTSAICADFRAYPKENEKYLTLHDDLFTRSSASLK